MTNFHHLEEARLLRRADRLRRIPILGPILADELEERARAVAIAAECDHFERNRSGGPSTTLRPYGKEVSPL